MMIFIEYKFVKSQIGLHKYITNMKLLNESLKYLFCLLN